MIVLAYRNMIHLSPGGREFRKALCPLSSLSIIAKGGDNVPLIRCRCAALIEDYLDKCPFCQTEYPKPATQFEQSAQNLPEIKPIQDIGCYE